MKNLEQLRLEIDEVHQKMLPLFLKRLELAETVWKIKNETQTPFLDPQRESQVLHQFDSALKDEALVQCVQDFQAQLLLITKRYLLTQYENQAQEKNPHNETK